MSTDTTQIRSKLYAICTSDMAQAFHGAEMGKQDVAAVLHKI
jgi:hypothetical protein